MKSREIPSGLSLLETGSQGKERSDGTVTEEGYTASGENSVKQVESQQTPEHNWSGIYKGCGNEESRLDSLTSIALNYLIKDNKNKEKIVVLDIGCGPGKHSVHLIDKCRDSNQPVHVTAFDNNESALSDFGTKQEKYTAEELKVLKRDFDTFSFEEKKYHLVMAIRVIPFNHPDACEAMVKRTLNSVREGGFFVGYFFGYKHNFYTSHKEEMSFHTPDDIIRLFRIAPLQEESSPAKPAQEQSFSQQIHTENEFRENFNLEIQDWDLIQFIPVEDNYPSYGEGSPVKPRQEYRVIAQKRMKQELNLTPAEPI